MDGHNIDIRCSKFIFKNLRLGPFIQIIILVYGGVYSIYMVGFVLFVIKSWYYWIQIVDTMLCWIIRWPTYNKLFLFRVNTN